MKIELPDEHGGNIISLEVIRRNMEVRRIHKECPHASVIIDTTEAELTCGACGVKLNPVEYLANLISEWSRVRRLCNDAIAAMELLKDKEKTKCEHCGKFTRVKPNKPGLKPINQ